MTEIKDNEKDDDDDAKSIVAMDIKSINANNLAEDSRESLGKQKTNEEIEKRHHLNQPKTDDPIILYPMPAIENNETDGLTHHFIDELPFNLKTSVKWINMIGLTILIVSTFVWISLIVLKIDKTKGTSLWLTISAKICAFFGHNCGLIGAVTSNVYLLLLSVFFMSAEAIIYFSKLIIIIDDEFPNFFLMMAKAFIITLCIIIIVVTILFVYQLKNPQKERVKSIEIEEPKEDISEIKEIKEIKEFRDV